MKKIIFSIILILFYVFINAQEIRTGIHIVETEDIYYGFYYECILEDSTEVAETLLYIDSKLKADGSIILIEKEINLQYVYDNEEKIFLISNIVTMPPKSSVFDSLDIDEKRRLMKAYVQVKKINAEIKLEKEREKNTGFWKM